MSNPDLLWEALGRLRNLRDEANAALNEVGGADFPPEALTELIEELDRTLTFLADVRQKSEERTRQRRKRCRPKQR